MDRKQIDQLNKLNNALVTCEQIWKCLQRSLEDVEKRETKIIYFQMEGYNARVALSPEIVQLIMDEYENRIELFKEEIEKL